MTTRLSAAVERQLGALCDDTVRGLSATMPDLVDALGHDVVRRAIIAANDRFVARLGVAVEVNDEPLITLGRAAARSGVARDDVAAAFRYGTHQSWAALLSAAHDADLDAAAVGDLGTQILGYLDELVALAGRGFDRDADAVRRRRQQLQQALLADVLTGQMPPADLGRRAKTAGWRIPATVRAAEFVQPIAGEFVGPDDLSGMIDGQHILLIEASTTARRPGHLEGPATPVLDAHRSLRGLEAMRIAMADGALPTEGARWDDHLLALLLHAGRAPGSALVDMRLQALTSLPPGRRTWMLDTLIAWTDTPDQPTAIGRRLHLHPQSVRYRLRKLRELLGEDLDQPQARLELRVATETWRIFGGDSLQS